MSNLSKTTGIRRLDIESIKDTKGVQKFLFHLVDKIDEMYKRIRDFAEAGGMGTENWKVRESNAVDVAAGNAKAVKNLLIEHKTNGTKYEHEAS